MGNVAVIQDAESPLGAALRQDLLDRGWTVFGGGSASLESADGFTALAMDPQSLASIEAAAEIVAQSADHVDLLICNANRFEPDSLDALDFAAIERLYDINAVGPIRFLESFMPLTGAGLKRLCFVTDARASLGLAIGDDNYGYSMAKAALHRTVVILYNNLRKQGYSFRLYIPGEAATPVLSAADYFCTDRDDEGRLTIHDAHGQEWPF